MSSCASMELLFHKLLAQNLASGKNTQTGAARSRGANLAVDQFNG